MQAVTVPGANSPVVGGVTYVWNPPTAVLRPERRDLGAGQFAINPKPAGSRHRIEPKSQTSVYQSR